MDKTRPDDSDLIDEAERGPSQSGVSGGNLQREVAARAEEEHEIGSGGDEGDSVTRVHGGDTKQVPPRQDGRRKRELSCCRTARRAGHDHAFRIDDDGAVRGVGRRRLELDGDVRLYALRIGRARGGHPHVDGERGGHTPRSQQLHELILSDPDDGPGPRGISLLQLAEERGQHPSDALADWVLANGIRSRYTMLRAGRLVATPHDLRQPVGGDHLAGVYGERRQQPPRPRSGRAHDDPVGKQGHRSEDREPR